MLNIINSPTGEARVRSGDGVIDSLHLQGRQKGWCGRKGGRMWTAETLHVSELANLTGRMLTSPAQPSNYSARPDGFPKLEPGPFGPRRATRPVQGSSGQSAHPASHSSRSIRIFILVLLNIFVIQQLLFDMNCTSYLFTLESPSSCPASSTNYSPPVDLRIHMGYSTFSSTI